MKIIIIGSGIAGMAAAIRLAVDGYDVEVYEANKSAGGKIYQYQENGYRFDAGPSIFTLPELLEELFEITGKKITDYLEYCKSDITCKYFWDDNTIFTAYNDGNEFYSEVKEKNFNPDNVKRYLLHCKFLFDSVADIFLEKPIHKLSTFLNLKTIRSLINVYKFKIFKSTHQVHTRFLKNPKLIQLFNRYVTYGGSSPYKASGILALISHLENNLGAYMIEGGMYNLAPALYDLALETGVKFNFNSSVNSISVQGGKVKGIILNDEFVESDIVISNADMYYTYEKLLPPKLSANIFTKQPLSNSAIVFYWGMKHSFEELSLHNVLFSNNYKKEFDSIFEKGNIYSDPTIYLYISSKENSKDAPEYSENWYVSVNTPYDSGQDWSTFIMEVRKNIIQKINRILDIDIEPYIEFEKIDGPETLQKFTSSYKGALYGPNSNNKFSAFLRHPNYAKKIKGLYFCGGTVHPGGGIPLCLLSAKIVANLITRKYKRIN